MPFLGFQLSAQLLHASTLLGFFPSLLFPFLCHLVSLTQLLICSCHIQQRLNLGVKLPPGPFPKGDINTSIFLDNANCPKLMFTTAISTAS
ncbi:hypothetical protein BJ742DRAFT_842682 [Cladochytrium replicatum]|nr:hypothetical protein BJ742DRAFT_842682 [Cladochytrium replicatum]